MKIIALYAFLFVLVFFATYTLAPKLGLDGGPPSDRVIQTPFQDFRGLISV